MFGLPIPIIGLIIAVFILVFLVLKTRVHAFIAMLIASAIAGLIGGMSVTGNARCNFKRVWRNLREHWYRDRAWCHDGQCVGDFRRLV